MMAIGVRTGERTDNVGKKDDTPKSGPLGDPKRNARMHPNGWDSRRDAKPVTKPDRSGNKAAGYPVGDRNRDPDRGGK